MLRYMIRHLNGNSHENDMISRQVGVRDKDKKNPAQGQDFPGSFIGWITYHL